MINCKNKYLKYKQKYLKLKLLQKGGMEYITSMNDIINIDEYNTLSDYYKNFYTYNLSNNQYYKTNLLKDLIHSEITALFEEETEKIKYINKETI